MVSVASINPLPFILGRVTYSPDHDISIQRNHDILIKFLHGTEQKKSGGFPRRFLGDPSEGISSISPSVTLKPLFVKLEKFLENFFKPLDKRTDIC